MPQFSISLHEDDVFNLEHDNRERISPNVNPDKIKENIIYEGNISLKEFYEKTFQKAYEEHIERTKKKHPERVRGMPEKYYDLVTTKQAEAELELSKAKREGAHVKSLGGKEGYTKVAKQIIIQVGNTDILETMNPNEREETKEKMIAILKEYMGTFQKENPNFRIVNAIIHLDEISLAPHLHLTYVPVAETSRGQRVTNSLTGALKAMGFVSDKETPKDRRFEHCQTKWQTKERDRIIEISKKHGLDVGYNKGTRGKGKTIEEYRAAKQAEREAMMEQEAIDNRKKELSKVKEDIILQTNYFNEVSEDLYNSIVALDKNKSELITTEEKIKEKTEKLLELSKQVDEVPEVISKTLNICEKELTEKLIPPVPLSDNYERVSRGMFGNKKIYVMIPENEYEILDRRNGLKPQAVQEIIKDALYPLRKSILKLPVVKNLIATIQHLENEKSQWKKRFHKLEKEKAELQKEVQELQKEKEIADRVMNTKLGLPGKAIARMKEEATKEILIEQQQQDNENIFEW